MVQYEIFCYLRQLYSWCMMVRARYGAGACRELNEQGAYC
jgi:hypothetical protein